MRGPSSTHLSVHRSTDSYEVSASRDTEMGNTEVLPSGRAHSVTLNEWEMQPLGFNDSHPRSGHVPACVLSLLVHAFVTTFQANFKPKVAQVQSTLAYVRSER